MAGLNLKSLILDAFKEQAPDMHSKINDFQSFFKLNEITDGRYSITFLLDFFFMFDSSQINPWALLNEVRFLESTENVTRTKRATKFRKHPLKGLWHKHYYDGSMSMLANNVRNALDDYKLPYFQQMIEKADAAGEERFVEVTDIPRIVDDAVRGNLQRRRSDGKITGEWIMYAIYEDKNYYLGLGKHTDDQLEIRRKIETTCLLEFPFLNEVLS